MKQKINISIRSLVVTVGLFVVSVCANAQMIYSSQGLNIGCQPTSDFYGIRIDKLPYLHWTCKGADNFFRIDVSPANPRLAGSGNQVVFYNSLTSKFNSIQVANVYNYSDARAKDNVHTLTTGLNTILGLRPVTYEWKKADEAEIEQIALTDTANAKSYGPEEGMQYGFLAQEVEKVLPDAVKTDENGNKLINYTAIIPILVQAVQDLKAIVDVQEQQMAILTNKSVNLQGADAQCKIVQCTPNPVNDNVTITMQLSENVKSVVLVVSNLSGVVEKQIPMPLGTRIVTEDVSMLNSGIYVVSLYVNGTLCDSTRLIKE